MRNLLTILTLTLLFLGCNPSTPPTEPNEPMVQDSIANPVIPSTIDCQLNMTILEGNQLLIRDAQSTTIVCITTDSTTHDEALGESHRVFLVLDAASCEEVDRQVLPVNQSPDFPYRLADVSYHRTYKIIAIKGRQSIYCYDLQNKQLLKPVTPDFLDERIEEDAQSGVISHLEVWENYLMGYANDFGAFAFALQEGPNLENALAKAEYMATDGSYNSLFLVPTPEGKFQAIIPDMDLATNSFKVNLLFDAPKSINQNTRKAKQTGRYHFLEEAGTNKENLLIDLETATLVELPENLLTASQKEVLNWAGNRN